MTASAYPWLIVALSWPLVGSWPAPDRRADVVGECSRYAPQFSPDDAKICFASPATGNGDLYVANRDGSGCLRLTQAPGFEGDPVYSPAGDRIAYLSQPTFRGEAQHAWVMDADGGNPRQLTSGDVWDVEPSFTSDGQWIYFTRRILVERQFMSVIYDDREMYVNLDGSEPKELVGPPSWMFERYDPPRHGDLVLGTERVSPDEFPPPIPRFWVKDTGSGERRFLTKGYPSFFVNGGRRVIFSTDSYAISDRAVINIDGTGEKLLAIPEGSRTGPTLSHDGKTLAILVLDTKAGFFRARIDFGLYVVDLDDDSVRRLDCGSVGEGKP
jgi:Tol biopolymer transport system component